MTNLISHDHAVLTCLCCRLIVYPARAVAHAASVRPQPGHLGGEGYFHIFDGGSVGGLNKTCILPEVAIFVFSSIIYRRKSLLSKGFQGFSKIIAAL